MGNKKLNGNELDKIVGGISDFYENKSNKKHKARYKSADIICPDCGSVWTFHDSSWKFWQPHYYSEGENNHIHCPYCGKNNACIVHLCGPPVRRDELN